MRNENLVITCEEFPIGSLSPDHCYHALKPDSKASFIFDLTENEQSLTYLGFNPIASFLSKNEKIQIQSGETTEFLEGNPFSELRNFIKHNKPSITGNKRLFADALFGFVSYDAARLSYQLPDHHPETTGKPDIYLTLFSCLLIFDHQQQTVTLAVAGEDKQSNAETMNAIRQKLSIPYSKLPNNRSSDTESIQADMDDQTYRDVLIKAKKYIHEGKVFQVVISRTFFAACNATPFQIHKAINAINPSPYMFLFETADYAIIGSSPGKLVSVDNRMAEIVVLGGSHPKITGRSDRELGEALLKDEKEVAEHNMKMETARNDAASLSIPGTLEITELRGYRVFSHILHMISRFKGKLKENFDYIDAIQKVLPSASITGSPKEQAMHIIDECERNHRGIYGGAMCLLDFEGNLRSCLTIRTIVLDHGVAYIRAGAGLVSNSDPDYEVNESIHKANAAIATLKHTEEFPP